MTFENLVRDFLHDKVAKSPRAVDSELQELSDEEREAVRQLEDTAILGEVAQLSDVLRRFENMNHFPKQYVIFKRDFESTLALVRQKQNARGNSPKMRDTINRVFSKVMHTKFAIMEEWYFIHSKLQTSAKCFAERRTSENHG